MKDREIQEKGITLIALVVTIIILLILVGVTISQITGENGLVKKAKEAVEKYKNASEEEQIQLGKIDQYVSDNIITLKDIMTAEDGDVLEGKTYIGKTGIKSTGSMPDQSGQTVTASKASSEGDNILITIPQFGYYDTDSKISVAKGKMPAMGTSGFSQSQICGKGRPYNFTALHDGVIAASLGTNNDGETAKITVKITNTVVLNGGTTYYSGSAKTSVGTWLYPFKKGDVVNVSYSGDHDQTWQTVIYNMDT